MVTDATKGTRVDTAYVRLKTELRSNRMPAGHTVPETEIADMLGMSRTPVREALIRLEAEGLIELIPRRGMRVLPIKPSDMREIYEILVSVEPDAAARVAAMGLSDDALAPLEDAMIQMEVAVEARDLEKWAEADDMFHQILLDLSGNRRLGAIVEQLYDQAHRARMMTLRLRDFPSQSTAEHRALLEHVRQGQVKEAYDAFRMHRLRTMDELLAHLEKLGFAPV